MMGGVGAVWTVVYALMGIAAWIVWRSASADKDEHEDDIANQTRIRIAWSERSAELQQAEGSSCYAMTFDGQLIKKESLETRNDWYHK